MVDCTGFIKPLNLECLLVNTFAGTWEIFIFVGLIMIATIGAYFRMLNSTMLIMFVLFGLFMQQYMGGIYFLAVMLTGLVVMYGLGKLMKS